VDTLQLHDCFSLCNFHSHDWTLSLVFKMVSRPHHSTPHPTVSTPSLALNPFHFSSSLTRYPAKRFLNEKILGAKDGNAKYYTPTILLPGLITYFVFSDITMGLVCSLYVALWLEFVDQMHTSYHLKDHWCEKYTWFQVLRQLHYKHHVGDMMSNFGIVDFCMDFLLGNLAVC
jgi:hypothetical protein